MYALARNFCEGSDYTEILSFVTTTCGTFFDNINKAKVAKIVRQVLDIVSLEAPNEHEMLADVCKAVVKWCKECNRCEGDEIKDTLTSSLTQPSPLPAGPSSASASSLSLLPSGFCRASSPTL